jgi:hypothetical protein
LLLLSSTGDWRKVIDPKERKKERKEEEKRKKKNNYQNSGHFDPISSNTRNANTLL